MLLLKYIKCLTSLALMPDEREGRKLWEWFKSSCLKNCIENATSHSLFHSLQETNCFYGYRYLGNSLYGNSLIYLANTVGLKQRFAQYGVKVCVCGCASDSSDDCGCWFDDALPQTVSLTPLWHFTAVPGKNNTLTKTLTPTHLKCLQLHIPMSIKKKCSGLYPNKL